jgi:hypothetical protein
MRRTLIHNRYFKGIFFLSSIGWKREGTTHVVKTGLNKHRLIGIKSVFQRPPKSSQERTSFTNFLTSFPLSQSEDWDSQEVQHQ